MSANRNNYFYEELTSVAATYVDDGNFKFNFAARHVKIDVIGGEVAYKINGPDNTAGKDDGVIIPADGPLDFDGLEAHRISVRQKTATITRLRIWAWK